LPQTRLVTHILIILTVVGLALGIQNSGLDMDRKI